MKEHTKARVQALSALIATVIAGAPQRKRMDGLRQDAAYDTAFLARELTQIESEMYRVEYQDIQFRNFIPIKNSGLNPAAKFFVYKVWDYFGLAKWITDYADDLPRVGLRAKEVMSAAKDLGDSYGWSAKELMQAGMAGIALEREEARAAFEFIERKMEDAAVFGAPEVGMLGWANHPGVSTTTAAANGDENGGTNSTQFQHKTPAQILTDLHGFVFTMRNRAKQKGAFTPNTLALPPSIYGLISVMPVSDLSPLTTVLDVFIKTNPYVKTVVEWDLLETADGHTVTNGVASGAPRAVLYRKDGRVGEVYIPMEARAEQPQQRNLAVVVNVWATFGGFILRQPLAYMYIDGLGPAV
jgi:hypothetical protein